jgi:hypothetical protein
MPVEGRVERPDRGHRQHERHDDSREPLLEQAAEAPLAVDEHREVAAQQEEERHAETVDDEEHQWQHAARPRVVHGPWGRIEGQARMHGDSERHREPAEGVEVVAAIRHSVSSTGLRCIAGPKAICCAEFLIA